MAASAASAAAQEFSSGVKRPEAKDDDEALRKLVEENDDLEFKEGFPKITVKSSGHELPLRLKDVMQYLNGDKYKRGKAKWYAYDYSKFEPTVVQHKTLKKHLHCKVTGVVLPKIPAVVERHMGSERIKQALKEQEEAAKRKEEKQQARKKVLEAIKAKKKAEREKAGGDKAAEKDGTEDGKPKKPKAGKLKKGKRKAGKADDTKGGDKAAVAATAEAGKAGDTGKRKGKKIQERAVKRLRKGRDAGGAEA